MEKYYGLIEQVYNASVLFFIIPSLVALFKWKYFDNNIKLASLNIIRGCIISCLALFLASKNYNNQFVFFISPCLDIALVSLLAVNVLNVSKIFKIIISIVCLAFIAIMIFEYFQVSHPRYGVLTSFETIFVIFLTSIMLRKVILFYKSGMYKKVLLALLFSTLISNLFSVLYTSFSRTITEYSSTVLQVSVYLSAPFISVITNLMCVYAFYLIQHKMKEPQIIN